VADGQADCRQADEQVSRRTESRQAKGTRGLIYCQVDLHCTDSHKKYIIICISTFDEDEFSILYLHTGSVSTRYIDKPLTNRLSLEIGKTNILIHISFLC
jgi:hypothetical protein